MATSSPSAESQALTLQFDYLYRSIDVTPLLPGALSAGVITESQRGECAEQLHGSKRVEKFLDHLVRRVNGDTSNFHKFLHILRQTKQDVIASCLQDQFRTLSYSMTIVTPSAKQAEEHIMVPDDLVKDLVDLRFDYSSLLFEIQESLQSITKEQQDKITRYLHILLYGTIDVPADCKLLSSFDALARQCSIFNIYNLKKFNTKLPENIKGTIKQHIDAYERQRDDFMSSTRLNQFKKLFPVTAASNELSTGKTTMTLILNDGWSGRTLSDLQILMQRHLGVTANHLYLYSIGEGSVTVCMLCSDYEATNLEEAVSVATNELHQSGVLQVLIGKSIVLNCLQLAEVSPRTPSIKLKELLEVELVNKVKQKEKPVPVPALVDDDAEDKNKKKEDDFTWRRLPSSERKCFIIGSIGDCLTPSVDAVPKLRDPSTTESELLKRELEVVQKKIEKVPTIKMADIHDAQMSKEYYVERIKLFMKECKTPAAIIWYTGHGERSTGNWCFKDGVISFEEVFALYMDHFKGKVLTLVCDCSYSGSWWEQCARKLDEIGVPSCGHHTRERGILIKVYCSCEGDQQATWLTYSEEGVIVDDEILWFWYGKKLTSGQTTAGNGNFTYIRCRKKSDEGCEVPPHHTWVDRIINTLNYVYTVRGKDRGRPAWHYVLVDKEKVEEFKAQAATGHIDVAEYGKILHSGWGENPSEEIKEQIAEQFTCYLKPK